MYEIHILFSDTSIKYGITMHIAGNFSGRNAPTDP